MKPQLGLSPSEIPSESTEKSSSPFQKEHSSRLTISTFHRTKALQDSVKKHFPLVATSLILFVISRSLFYTYFGVCTFYNLLYFYFFLQQLLFYIFVSTFQIGSVVPTLFPPDLSHSVYWVMHSYAVLAPIVHLMLDKDLRSSVSRFINEGTFELSPFSIATAIAADNANARQRHLDHVLPKVSVIDDDNPPRHHHHHHHHHHHNHGHHKNHRGSGDETRDDRTFEDNRHRV